MLVNASCKQVGEQRRAPEGSIHGKHLDLELRKAHALTGRRQAPELLGHEATDAVDVDFGHAAPQRSLPPLPVPVVWTVPGSPVAAWQIVPVTTRARCGEMEP